MVAGSRFVVSIVLLAVCGDSMRIQLFQDEITADASYNHKKVRITEKSFAKNEMANLAKLAEQSLLVPTHAPTNKNANLESELNKANQINAEFGNFITDIDNCQDGCDKAKEVEGFLPTTDAPTRSDTKAPSACPSFQPVPSFPPTAAPTASSAPTPAPTFEHLDPQCDTIHIEFMNQVHAHDYWADFLGNYKVTKFQHGDRPIFQQASKAKFGGEHIQLQAPNLMFFSPELGGYWVVTQKWKNIKKHLESIQVQSSIPYPLVSPKGHFPFQVEEWLVKSERNHGQKVNIVCGAGKYDKKGVSAGVLPTPAPTTKAQLNMMFKKEKLKEAAMFKQAEIKQMAAAKTEKKQEEEKQADEKIEWKARKRRIVTFQGKPVTVSHFARVAIKHYWQLFHTDVATGEVLPLLNISEAKVFVKSRFPVLYKSCYVNYHCGKYLKLANVAKAKGW
jgi:hypothetical protein